ncbi:hypothetical protein JCM15457_415 [Liquorilactobacillus sucicola DSM 21376 = JCM 15457]|nr:alpha/beta hydrolase [Liquorilactobacillus sucicola]GAJ25547.1 hypothetical protein JCM15457_415 [Liquorilactobacillus sucicola DSM 21376 = JCM 15457]
MTKKKLYVLHGYTSNRNANWFPWLKQQVEEKMKKQVKVLQLPNADHPKPAEWDQTCSRKISSENGITLVGHSLGCIEALRFLSQHEIKDVNLVLVSGFDEKLHTLPELAEFTEPSINYAEVLPKLKRVVVISALDDDIVPYEYSETLARHLHAKFILMPEGKHFIDAYGTVKLPVVYQELAAMLA